MPETKKPQDHQKKATEKTSGFTFDHAGKTYHLPDARDGAFDVPGKVTREAIERPDDDMAQVRMGFALLSAVDAPADARTALDEMSTRQMLEVMGAWMGESLGSSE